METSFTIIDHFSKKSPNFHLRLLNEAADAIKDQLPGLSSDPVEDLYLIKSGLGSIPICPICSSDRKFINYKRGYQNTCHELKCINAYAQTKREAAFMEKYGVKNPKQVPEINEKIKVTNQQRYGSENAFASDIIKDRIKDTLIERYGTDNPMKNVEVVQKVKNTNLDRYGVDNTYQLPKVLDKIKERYGDDFGWGSNYFIEKSKETCKKNHDVEFYLMKPEAHERGTRKMNDLYGGRGLGSDVIKEKIEDSLEAQYGVRHPMGSDEIRKRLEDTCMKRYGGTNVMHSAEIVDRVMTNAMKLKEAVLPSGKTVKVQGYEPLAIKWLLDNGYDENDLVLENKSIESAIGRITYQNAKGSTSRYYPDIYIPADNLIIEVKSEYTMKQNMSINLKKRDACLKLGLDFRFMVISNTGKRFDIEWL